ncbi:thioesterase family protein [Evansella sp. AB-P1]|uniref:acyl-CoA thioesterase n=1 Tax=Evansella sp. AB-P1 TaxID=3037653 RepID=UPI00241C703D|nr:thioesterase family protein [Evansella sp. AB-P1]MDG5786919.1 thioesterase family protein [Evansella sp. AB-P1]
MANILYIGDFSKWKNSFKYSYPITVRFSETDAFGHVNNTIAFVYFEEGRINYFKDIGLSEEWFSKKGKLIPVTADLQCDYKKQVYFDENIEVSVKINMIGKTSVDLHYMITNSVGEVCMTGRGKMVQVSRATGVATPWSESSRKLLEANHFSID